MISSNDHEELAVQEMAALEILFQRICYYNSFQGMEKSCSSPSVPIKTYVDAAVITRFH